MRAGQWTYLAPDGADIGGLAAVETLAFVQDAAAHSLLLHVVVVAVDEGSLLFQLLFGELCLELLADSGEGLFAGMLVAVTFAGNGVCLSVASLVYSLAQLFVVHFVVVGALHGRANLFGQLLLSYAHGFDGFVGSLQGSEQVLL